MVDILPVGYAIDRGEMIADPLGRSGRNLEVTYQVYWPIMIIWPIFRDCSREAGFRR